MYANGVEKEWKKVYYAHTCARLTDFHVPDPIHSALVMFAHDATRQQILLGVIDFWKQ